MAKGRRYVRDARGRFASVGATARGGRLGKASGKRATVTAKAKGGGKGTIGKPQGLKPQRGIAVRQAAAVTKGQNLIRKGVTESRLANTAKRSRNLELNRYNKSDPFGSAKENQALQLKMAKSASTSRRAQEFLRSYGTPMNFARRPKMSTADSPNFGTRKGRRRRR